MWILPIALNLMNLAPPPMPGLVNKTGIHDPIVDKGAIHKPIVTKNAIHDSIVEKGAGGA